MKKSVLSILLLGCLSASLGICEKAPQLLTQAAECLATKQFLPSSRAATLTLGYLLDEKSYPDDKVIYLVDYASPSESNGWVFAMVLTGNNGHQHFDIQNNATFVVSNKGFDGVSFVDPPLGGTWTQEHLASAIQQIEKQPRFTILKESLSTASSEGCRSYTDSR